MRFAFPVVVERGGGRYGAYAPELPGSFVAASTAAEARRRARDEIATSLTQLGQFRSDFGALGR